MATPTRLLPYCGSDFYFEIDCALTSCETTGRLVEMLNCLAKIHFLWRPYLDHNRNIEFVGRRASQDLYLAYRLAPATVLHPGPSASLAGWEAERRGFPWETVQQWTGIETRYERRLLKRIFEAKTTFMQNVYFTRLCERHEREQGPPGNMCEVADLLPEAKEFSWASLVPGMKGTREFRVMFEVILMLDPLPTNTTLLLNALSRRVREHFLLLRRDPATFPDFAELYDMWVQAAVRDINDMNDFCDPIDRKRLTKILLQGAIRFSGMEGLSLDVIERWCTMYGTLVKKMAASDVSKIKYYLVLTGKYQKDALRFLVPMFFEDLYRDLDRNGVSTKFTVAELQAVYNPQLYDRAVLDRPIPDCSFLFPEDFPEFDGSLLHLAPFTHVVKDHSSYEAFCDAIFSLEGLEEEKVTFFSRLSEAMRKKFLERQPLWFLYSAPAGPSYGELCAWLRGSHLNYAPGNIALDFFRQLPRGITITKVPRVVHMMQRLHFEGACDRGDSSLCRLLLAEPVYLKMLVKLYSYERELTIKANGRYQNNFFAFANRIWEMLDLTFTPPEYSSVPVTAVEPWECWWDRVNWQHGSSALDLVHKMRGYQQRNSRPLERGNLQVYPSAGMEPGTEEWRGWWSAVMSQRVIAWKQGLKTETFPLQMMDNGQGFKALVEVWPTTKVTIAAPALPKATPAGSAQEVGLDMQKHLMNRILSAVVVLSQKKDFSWKSSATVKCIETCIIDSFVDLVHFACQLDREESREFLTTFYQDWTQAAKQVAFWCDHSDEGYPFWLKKYRLPRQLYPDDLPVRLDLTDATNVSSMHRFRTLVPAYDIGLNGGVIGFANLCDLFLTLIPVIQGAML